MCKAGKLETETGTGSIGRGKVSWLGEDAKRRMGLVGCSDEMGAERTRDVHVVVAVEAR